MSDMSDARFSESPGQPAETPDAGIAAGLAAHKHWLWAAAAALAAVPAAILLMQFLLPRGAEADVPGRQADVQRQTDRRQDEAYVARVGNYLVTRRELADECLLRYQHDVLENLINRVIIQQACEERGITVSAAEVDQEIVRIAKQFEMPVDTWLKMLQNEREITPAQYRRDIIWPMLALKKLAAAEGEKFSVSEQEMERAFERDYGPKVEARMIMVNNLRRAQEAYERAVRNPQDFERLVREYSVEPNSRALGGKIPPIRKYLKIPYEGAEGIAEGSDVLWQKAFALRPGEVSSVIQIGYNQFVILLCEGFTEPIVKDIEDVRPELHKLIVDEKIQTAVARVFEKLKRETPVDNYLTKTSRGRSVQPAAGSASAGSSNVETPPKAAQGAEGQGRRQ